MHGRRSVNPKLVPIDSELERTARKIRAKNRIRDLLESPEPMALEDANDPPLTRQLREYFIPSVYTSPSCIRLPDVEATQYEIKSSIIQMLPSFYGLNNEDPYKHLDEFLEICSTFKIPNFTDDALRLRLFPFSLKDKAKH